MEKLSDYFSSFGKQVTTIIGSGGKTSLLWKLAESKREYKTLVTTTTHIRCPRRSENCYDYFFDTKSFCHSAMNDVKIGITLAADICDDAETGKLKSLPIDTLEHIVPLYDYVFIEGDGSRLLPVKAWADHEPVVIKSTGITAGLLPLWPLGKPINAAIVHRLPLFLALTGAREGDELSLKHLVKVITGNNGYPGLFKKAQGKKILFFNQVEDEKTVETVKELVHMLPKDFTDTLSGIIAGSIHSDRINFFL
ncbi:MAG: putative selenium-dependent hydroxylase accessory protein YqeC [Spirochaetaceae bacterium]|jgi:probable selenium-dependent hydroxylase accessory protein YqeC|nr:putative selenium-dependent hydroxylase accessory protein YqeC [Spirochaetaceae bacterium]